MWMRVVERTRYTYIHAHVFKHIHGKRTARARKYILISGHKTCECDVVHY